MVASNLGVNQGGSGCPEIGTDILGGGAIGPAIRVRDMGPDTAIQRVLGGFHHKVSLMLTGQQPQKGWDRGWVNPPPEDGMAEAGLKEVDTYVSCR